MKSAVQRVNEIANELQTRSIEDSGQRRITNLLSCISEIVSEKKLTVRQSITINQNVVNSDVNSIFANISESGIKRVLSNILDNSIESVDEPESLIAINLANVDDLAIITVSDNGKGIPRHILAKIGKEKITYGKIANNNIRGLGLYSAHKEIISQDGTIFIDSIEKEGTTITIKLPSCSPPAWFSSEIILLKNKISVMVDDDKSFHGALRCKLQQATKEPLSIIDLNSPDEFKQWMSRVEDVEKYIFFMDYEFVGQNINGLDLISRFNLSNNTYLMTSHHREHTIQEGCIKLKVFLISKQSLEYYP